MSENGGKPRAADLSRRAALGVFAAAGIGYACFGPRAGRERTDGRLVLDYWEKWTGIEGKAMQKIVREFNDSQDRLYVRYFATAGIDEKAQIAIAGGAPPDVVGLWNYSVPAFAAADAILPLDDLGRPYGVRPEMYAAGVRQVTTYKGRMLAAVNTGGVLALYYNKAQFREAGLNPERPPRTIPEFDAAAKTLLVRKGDRIERMGFHHREPGWWSFVWGNHFGGSLYDEGANRSTADSPENIAGYDWVQSFPREYGLGAVNEFRSSFGNYDSPLNAFISGRLSMVVQGPWLANMINLHRPDLEYGVAPFPVAESLYEPDRPIGLIDTDVLVIPRGALHPEASMEFIAYTQQQRVVEELSTVHCKGSPLAASSEAFVRDHPNRGIAVFEAIARSPRAFRVPPTPCWAQMKDEMDRALDRVWNLQGAPEAILKRSRERSQAALDLYAANAARRAGAGANALEASA